MTATQLSFLAPGLARASDPETSKRAAALVSRSWTDRVRDTLASHPAGLTDDELASLITTDTRKWPTIKSARSRVTRRSTGEVRSGQAVHVLGGKP